MAGWVGGEVQVDQVVSGCGVGGEELDDAGAGQARTALEVEVGDSGGGGDGEEGFVVD